MGLRGPGETKLETDRRRIRTRIARLRREIKGMRTVRQTKRARRPRNAVPGGGHRRLHQRRQVQPAQPAHRGRCAGGGRAVRHPRPDHPPGRTRPTAGSTPSPTRSASSGTCRTRSSRRSARRWRRSAEADLVVHVVDGAHPDPEEQVRAVREVLAEVGADELPELLVVNKVDAADEETLLRLKRHLAGRGLRLGPHRARDRRAARGDRAAAAPAGGRDPGRACRTTGVTWWPGCTGRARCSAPRTPARARCCTSGWTRRSPPSWRRTGRRRTAAVTGP